jgi:hypothetical protein
VAAGWKAHEADDFAALFPEVADLLGGFHGDHGNRWEFLQNLFLLKHP